MTWAKWKSYPLHVLLIPAFFVWHICNDYFGLIPAKYWLTYLLIYTAFSVILYFSGLLLLSNKAKAGCMATWLMFFILFWGPFHDLLRSISNNSVASSYKVLVPVIAISSVAFFFILKKRPGFSLLLNNWLNVIAALFIIIELVSSIYKIAALQTEKNDFAYGNHPGNLITKKIAPAEKPDIFFVIFDEYASSKALKRYYNFDNSRLDSALLHNNFYIAVNSTSNYNSTPVSIASALDFEYFPENLANKTTEPLTLLRGQFSIKKSSVPKILSMEGYSIVNLGISDFEMQPSSFLPNFDRDIPRIFYLNTLWGRLDKEILWNLPVPVFFQLYNKQEKSTYEYVANRNEINLSKIQTELQRQTDTPKFVFGHIMAPHHPYYYDSVGQKREYNFYDFMFEDSLYLNQLPYVNKLIYPLIEAANKDFKRPRVIIFAGDHGRRNITPESYQNNFRKHFMNLSAIYFSDKNYKSLYDTLSLVNNFRLVFNKYFDTKLPLLKDSTIKIQQWRQ